MLYVLTSDHFHSKLGFPSFSAMILSVATNNFVKPTYFVVNIIITIHLHVDSLIVLLKMVVKRYICLFCVPTLENRSLF